MSTESILVQVWAHPAIDGESTLDHRQELSGSPIRVSFDEGLTVGRSDAEPSAGMNHIALSESDLGAVSWVLPNVPSHLLTIQPLRLPSGVLATEASVTATQKEMWQLVHDGLGTPDGLWRRVYSGEGFYIYGRLDGSFQVLLSATIVSDLPRRAQAPGGPVTVLTTRAQIALRVTEELRKGAFPDQLRDWEAKNFALVALCLLVKEHQTSKMQQAISAAIDKAGCQRRQRRPAVGASTAVKTNPDSQFVKPAYHWGGLDEQVRIRLRAIETPHHIDTLLHIEKVHESNSGTRSRFVEQVLAASLVTRRELELVRKYLPSRDAKGSGRDD